MIVKKKQGGSRPGAGRKPKEGELRKSRTLRATDEEWEKILEFARNLKTENMSMYKDRIKGALLGTAVGDALGGPVEFCTREEIVQKHNGELKEMLGGGWLNLDPGEVTDDTQMTLAVAEGIAANPESPVPEIGKRFIDWYDSQPKDIGNTCRLAISMAITKSADNFIDIKKWHKAAKETDRALGGKSAGNGALMRTVYPGLYYGEAGIKIASDIAKMTHWNDESTEACKIYTQIIVALIDGGTVQDVTDIIKGTRYENRASRLKPTGYVVDSMECALTCLLENDNFMTTVVRAASLGGDADTIGAITGGMAGALYGAEAIPRLWTKALSPGIKKQINRLAEIADLAQRSRKVDTN